MKLKEIKTKRWFRFLTNMYVLALTIFAIWMSFFDTNSLLIHLELQREIDTLEKSETFLKKEIKRDQKIIERLSNKQALEKFAREEYYLKKKNEQIYLIEYQDSIQSPDRKD